MSIFCICEEYPGEFDLEIDLGAEDRDLSAVADLVLGGESGGFGNPWYVCLFGLGGGISVFVVLKYSGVGVGVTGRGTCAGVGDALFALFLMKLKVSSKSLLALG